MAHQNNDQKSHFPPWLRHKLPEGGNLWKTNDIIKSHCLHTVCDEAKCPNRNECYSKKTATFLVMGDECTRSCAFCNVKFNPKPKNLDPQEPERIADSIKKLGLSHAVITMVTRDDLKDGGADHLVKIITETRKTVPSITIEVLTSDFDGNTTAYDTILDSRPDIFNHNVETVRALSPKIRNKASYERSLSLLRYVKDNSDNILIKSGLMVGLGETQQEVEETIKDLYTAGCDIITIGQYLRPSKNNLIVKEFIHPDTFAEYEKFGLSLGVKYMHCGPFVRSSYNAASIKQALKSGHENG